MHLLEMMMQLPHLFFAPLHIPCYFERVTHPIRPDAISLPHEVPNWNCFQYILVEQQLVVGLCG